MGREIRLIRALADEGYQYGLNDGVPPIPRDRMVTLHLAAEALARRLMDEIEAGGIPVVMLRGDGAMNPDGVRDYDLLVPAIGRDAGRRAPRGARADHDARAEAWREAYIREHGVADPPSRPRAGPPPAGHRARASASDGEIVGAIGPGLVVLLGVGPDDTDAIADDLARRGVELRIFRDEDGRTNRSLLDVGGAALVVSQFTLYADTRRGRRPGFTGAAPPELAERLYERFAAALRAAGLTVATGPFGAEMAVELVNDGPFTIWLDSADRGPSGDAKDRPSDDDRSVP